MSRGIENWPPGLGHAALWIRFHLIERWSVWHRSSEIPVELQRSGARVTECGIGLSSQVTFEERSWRGIPDELCCEVCLRRYLVARVPPLGSPGGESAGARGRIVVRTSRRRRLTNQPTT
jgi:hypothetical protein